jgi:hypothetical protein
MKRLRRKHQLNKSFKYIVSHEYGSKTGRPHHHAIIFGWTPANQSYLQKAPSGEPLYTSPELEKLWPYGYHSIGEANEKTAYYIASYALKSNTYRDTDNTTGETVEYTDSMDSSRNTAIGYEYFINNYKQLTQLGTILPRYYVKLLETAPDRLENKITKQKKICPKFKEFALQSQDHLQIYQDNLMINYKNSKTAHQRFAKFVITEQKQSIDSNFRTAPEEKKKIDSLKYYLRSDRDTYHKQEKKNAKS